LGRIGGRQLGINGFLYTVEVKKMAIQQLGSLSLGLIYAAVILGVANICLLLALINAYWKTYKQVKSEFTIGLLYFSTFLLLQNIMSTLFIALPFIIPGEFYLSELQAELHGPRLPLLMINIVQFVALSILFKITRK
jgi:hypothetical protein